MSLRFLNANNCRALLPRIQGLPVARQLDDYLAQDVNDFPGDFQYSATTTPHARPAGGSRPRHPEQKKELNSPIAKKPGQPEQNGLRS